MALSGSDISLSIGDVTILRHLSISIAAGEVVVLAGPNGAGKSSLLRALSREWAKAGGRFELDQQDLQDWPAQELARKLAVLPQHSNLQFAFTASEVVELARTPHRTGRERDREIVDAALAAIDADTIAHRLYPELSGGERQRVQIARVFAQIWPDDEQSARYLLLDEPAAALDLAHQNLLIDSLRSLARANTGICVVLHDLNLAARLADTMVFMRDGEVVARGTPEEVMQSAIIESVFDVACTITVHPKDGTPLAVF